MLHGILILDKPANVSSAFVVDKVRKRAGVAKAGHTGTLDPLATGVLPVCLGAACKLAGYLIAEDKAYEAELELGRRTDTLDRTGVTLEERYEAADRVTEEEIEAALAKQRGALEQLPPMYSAIKQDGIRMYQRARAGEEVTRVPRSVVVHRLELRWKRGRKVGLTVHCSKGTFVRSLVDDLGRELGCGASLTELRRILCGSYSLAQAIPLEGLTPEVAAAHVIPLSRMLAVPSIVVPQRRYGELRDGRPEVLGEYAGELQGMAQMVSEAGEMLALIEGRAGRPRYVRVFLESLKLGLQAAGGAEGAAVARDEEEAGPAVRFGDVGDVGGAAGAGQGGAAGGEGPSVEGGSDPDRNASGLESG